MAVTEGTFNKHLYFPKIFWFPSRSDPQGVTFRRMLPEILTAKHIIHLIKRQETKINAVSPAQLLLRISGCFSLCDSGFDARTDQMIHDKYNGNNQQTHEAGWVKILANPLREQLIARRRFVSSNSPGTNVSINGVVGNPAHDMDRPRSIITSVWISAKRFPWLTKAPRKMSNSVQNPYKDGRLLFTRKHGHHRKQ